MEISRNWNTEISVNEGNYCLAYQLNNDCIYICTNTTAIRKLHLKKDGMTLETAAHIFFGRFDDKIDNLFLPS